MAFAAGMAAWCLDIRPAVTAAGIPVERPSALAVIHGVWQESR